MRLSSQYAAEAIGTFIRTEQLFLSPKNPKTSDYIEGRYG